MSPIDAAILVLILALPLHWLVLRHFDQICDPAYLRKRGIVVVRERALQGHAEPIGEYRGQPIWASVTFMGLVYRFDHVSGSDRRENLAAGELFIEPGLVYVVE
jgi:hypothetical protein